MMYLFCGNESQITLSVCMCPQEYPIIRQTYAALYFSGPRLRFSVAGWCSNGLLLCVINAKEPEESVLLHEEC